MKFIIGFFMAWGNFITLPCPYKRWDSTLKNMMLAFLPSVGAVVGLLWMGLLWLFRQLELPLLVGGLVMIFYIFAVCGFMHLDGFMDCNDAILSRRPLEERQRILKDSTVGAFAVVTLAFLLLGWFAAMTEALPSLDYGALLLLPVVSRGVSGLHVLTCVPIGHSQYVKDYEVPGRWKYRAAVAAQLAVWITAAILLSVNLPRTLVMTAVITVSGIFSCSYARRQLGGMSGDIAGYTICISELAGILTLAVW
ncbi:adenosylcobinamide-GDP ribazoletransferase [Ihubacter sp. mB4P-1]|uniref:adenosylcobinamide-GDP ribazoletransferase n=1 Tax=Ihubacter sp. mB4P-1 TaxID=3242370 RepID=UPI00137A1DE3